MDVEKMVQDYETQIREIQKRVTTLKQAVESASGGELYELRRRIVILEDMAQENRRTVSFLQDRERWMRW